MSARDRRMSSESSEDSPLLTNTAATNGRGPALRNGNIDSSYVRERGDLPMWRHILENKMTWAWYTIVASSSAVSLMIYHLPYQIHRLWILGAAVYMFSLVLFLVLLLVHLVRFLVRPSMLPASMTHPNEGLFVSTFASALGLLVISGATYSEKLHTASGTALRTAYWIYVVTSLLFGIGTPVLQYSKGAQHRDIRDMTALATQTTIPLSLAGPAAAAVVSHMGTHKHHHAAIAILAIGAALQGMGALVSLLYLSNIIERLHNSGFPDPKYRPSMFLAAAPPALTSYAAVRLAQQALRHFPANSDAPDGATDIVGGVSLYYGGIVTALIFWGLAAWFIFVALAANLSCLGQIAIGRQQLQLFNLIFPNAVFALATFEVLKVFGYPHILTVLAEIGGVAVIGSYAVVLLSAIFGITTGQLISD